MSGVACLVALKRSHLSFTAPGCFVCCRRRSEAGAVVARRLPRPCQPRLLAGGATSTVSVGSSRLPPLPPPYLPHSTHSTPHMVSLKRRNFACGLGGVSDYFQGHFAGVNLGLHGGAAEACGHCILASCTDAALCPAGGHPVSARHRCWCGRRCDPAWLHSLSLALSLCRWCCKYWTTAVRVARATSTWSPKRTGACP